MSNKLLGGLGVAALLLAALVAYSAFGEPLASGVTYEEAVRAAALRMRTHREECRKEEPSAAVVCAARVDAEWRKAMALAEAKRLGTKGDWNAAAREIERADERTKRIAERRY